MLLFPQVHQKYDLPSSTSVGKELFCATKGADMKFSKNYFYLGLVIEDLSQNNKKIVFKNIEYAAQMFGAEYILNSQ